MSKKIDLFSAEQPGFVHGRTTTVSSGLATSSESGLSGVLRLMYSSSGWNTGSMGRQAAHVWGALTITLIAEGRIYGRRSNRYRKGGWGRLEIIKFGGLEH